MKVHIVSMYGSVWAVCTDEVNADRIREELKAAEECDYEHIAIQTIETDKLIED